jgi:hypothetical protein
VNSKTNGHKKVLKRMNKKKCYTCTQWNVIVKGKAIPLQAWIGPEGSRRLRLSDFKTIGT